MAELMRSYETGVRDTGRDLGYEGDAWEAARAAPTTRMALAKVLRGLENFSRAPATGWHKRSVTYHRTRRRMVPIVIWLREGRKVLLDGRHRLSAAIAARRATVPVKLIR